MESKAQTKEILVLSFFLSFFLHLVFILSLSLIKTKQSPVHVLSFPHQHQQHQIDVTYEEEKNQNKFFPKFSPFPLIEEEELKKKKAPRLSRFLNRVKEETVAMKIGVKNINRQPKNLLSSVAPSNNDEREAFFEDVFFSTVNFYFPNLKKTNITILNTNAYKYRKFYIFFNRIRKELIPRWYSNINNMIKFISPQQLKRHQHKSVLFTELQLLIDKTGYIKKMNLTTSSGIKELDYTVIDTMKDIAPFLNPPQDLVSKNGDFPLEYRFAFIL